MIDLFSFLKKKKIVPSYEVDINSFNKIKIFVFYVNDAYRQVYGSFLDNMKKIAQIEYFNDIEKLIYQLQTERPDFFVSFLFNMNGFGGELNAKTFVRRIKDACDKTVLIGFDGIRKPELYLNAGFDYVICAGISSSKVEFLINKILLNAKLDDKEKALVYEKKEFYDYVAKNGFFDLRSKKTANTSSELRFLAKRISGKILDAGCGNGRLTIPLAQAGFLVYGVDISKELIDQANKYKKDSKFPVFIQADLLHTPFSNGEFNSVIMMWHIICEFRKFRFDLLKEMSRILANDGLLIFDFPNVSKHIKINESGVYENQVDSFAKYVGLVPDLEEMLVFLKSCGFSSVYYEQINWGSPKIVIIAKKMSF